MDAQGFSGIEAHSRKRAGIGLLMPLLLSVLLAILGACAPGAGGGSGKHIGAWLSIRMVDAQHGWASTYLAILRTSDGGAHWQDVTPWQKLSPWGHSATFLTASIAWVVQQGNKDDKTPAQVFRTADGGQTWQHSDLPDTVSAFTPTSSPYQGNRTDVSVSSVSASDAQHAWVVSTRIFTPSHNSDNIQITYTHVLQTSDGGKTWSVLLQGLPGTQSSTSPSAPRIGWAVLVNATTGWLNGPTPSTLLVTQDGGATWQQHALPPLPIKDPTGGAATQLLVPTFLSAQQGILSTLTYGRNGNNQYTCYVTRDGGTTWTVTPPLTLQWFPATDYRDATHWSFLTDTSILYKTVDGGQHWTTSQLKTAFQRIEQVQFLSSTIGWAIGNNIPANGSFMGDSDTVTAPVKTTDGGKTWTALSYNVS